MERKQIYIIAAVIAACLLFIGVIAFAIKKNQKPESRTPQDPAPAPVDLTTLEEAALATKIAASEVSSGQLLAAVMKHMAANEEAKAAGLYKIGASLVDDVKKWKVFLKELVKQAKPDNLETIYKVLRFCPDEAQRTLALKYAYDEGKMELFEGLIRQPGDLVKTIHVLPSAKSDKASQVLKTIFDVVAHDTNDEKSAKVMNFLIAEPNAKVNFSRMGSFTKVVLGRGNECAKDFIKDGKTDIAVLTLLLADLASSYQVDGIKEEAKKTLAANAKILADHLSKQKDRPSPFSPEQFNKLPADFKKAISALTKSTSIWTKVLGGITGAAGVGAVSYAAISQFYSNSGLAAAVKVAGETGKVVAEAVKATEVAEIATAAVQTIVENTETITDAIEVANADGTLPS